MGNVLEIFDQRSKIKTSFVLSLFLSRMIFLFLKIIAWYSIYDIQLFCMDIAWMIMKDLRNTDKRCSDAVFVKKWSIHPNLSRLRPAPPQAGGSRHSVDAAATIEPRPNQRSLALHPPSNPPDPRGQSSLGTSRSSSTPGSWDPAQQQAGGGKILDDPTQLWVQSFYCTLFIWHSISCFALALVFFFMSSHILPLACS